MHHRFKLSVLSVLLTTTLLIPNARAEYTMSLEAWPDWVAESMQEEARKQKLRDVKMPIDTIKAKMPGKSGEAQAIDDGWYFTSDIKAESPLECYIYTADLDLASLTNILAENNIAAMGEAYGTIDNRNIYHVDAGAVNGAPFLALEWIYTLAGESEMLVAFTKVRAAVRKNIAYACTHNAIGHRETFAAAFDAFVTNVESELSDTGHFYEEIATMDINGFGTGVAYMSYTVDAEGDIEAYSTESMLVPAAANSLMYSDSISYTYSTPDLAMISSIQVDVENGEISNNLRLGRNDAGNWVSSGLLQGKEVETEIDGALVPATELAVIAATRDLFAGEEESVDIQIWLPNADPTRFIDASLIRDDADVERQANFMLGPMSILGQFDESGNMTSGKIAAGPVTISIDSIWADGSVWE